MSITSMNSDSNITLPYLIEHTNDAATEQLASGQKYSGTEEGIALKNLLHLHFIVI